MKKPYEKPRIIHTEQITARAVACAAGDDSCGAGPIFS